MHKATLKLPGYLDMYADDPLVRKNKFVASKPEKNIPPSFKSARHLLPNPEWEGHNDVIECYWKTWKLAFKNIHRAYTKKGFVTNYIDTAFFNNNLFMWDSAFILMFARYGNHAFNFQRTLDNFYAHQHPDGFITREIKGWDGKDRFHRFDPSSTGPEVLPWCEWEYWLNFNDKARLKAVFPPLVAYHRWMRTYRTWKDGSYWSTGWGCGMDNCPRTPKGYNRNFQHGHMSWIDSTLQAIFSANILTLMATTLNYKKIAKEMKEESSSLTRFVNMKMWNKDTGSYCDRFRDGQLSQVKHIGIFWALLAGVANKKRRDLLLALLRDKKTFNRWHRVPSLSADHPEYQRNGDYWRGSVWPPTNYMILRGLTACEENDLAAEIALNHLEKVVEVFKKTGTVYENYAPELSAKGSVSKPDFVGWGGLAPVAVFLEYVLGFRSNIPENILVWDVRQKEAHGVSRFPFGASGLINLSCRKRASIREKPIFNVSSNIPFTLDLRWNNGRELLQIKPTEKQRRNISRKAR